MGYSQVFKRDIAQTPQHNKTKYYMIESEHVGSQRNDRGESIKDMGLFMLGLKAYFFLPYK